MKKKILITGATDGLGLETAKILVAEGHTVILHGRNREKLKKVEQSLSERQPNSVIESFVADLSDIKAVTKLAEEVAQKYSKLDVLINNAGVFKAQNPKAEEGLDLRFVVNTISPYLLTKQLFSLFDRTGRVINLSSAAQSPVALDALYGKVELSDNEAYAQSKLALTMWSYEMAVSFKNQGPAIIAINPKSFLGTKMVEQAYGVVGTDIGIGADILKRAALSEEFSHASGQYFDNDIGQFTSPHPDVNDTGKRREVMMAIETILSAKA